MVASTAALIVAAVALLGGVVPERAEAGKRLKLTAPQRLSSAGGNAFDPVSAIDARGTVTVGWDQLPGDFSGSEPVVRRIEPDRTVGPPITLDRFFAGGFEIASDSRGRSLVARLGSAEQGGPVKLGVSRIAADGNAGSVQTLWEKRRGRRVNTVAGLRLLIDSRDIATLVWAEGRLSRPKPGRLRHAVGLVRAIQLDPEGEVSAVATLSRHRGDVRDLEVARDRSDRIRVLWRQDRGGKGRIRLATLSAAGNLRGEQVLFRDRGPVVFPSAAVSGGHLVAVRERLRRSRQVLFAAALRPSGAPRTFRKLGGSRNSDEMNPRLADGADGSALAAWDGGSRVKAARLASGSGRPGPAGAISGPSGGEDVRGVEPALDSQGRAIVAWRRGTTSAEAVRLGRGGRPGAVEELQDGFIRGIQILIDERDRATLSWSRTGESNTAIWVSFAD